MASRFGRASPRRKDGVVELLADFMGETGFVCGSCSSHEPDRPTGLSVYFLSPDKSGPAGVGEISRGLVFTAPRAELDEVSVAGALVLWTSKPGPEARNVPAARSAILYRCANRAAELAGLLWRKPPHHSVGVLECLLNRAPHKSRLCRGLHGLKHARESFVLARIYEGRRPESSGRH